MIVSIMTIKDVTLKNSVRFDVAVKLDALQSIDHEVVKASKWFRVNQ
jgi:hypothetical protein